VVRASKRPIVGKVRDMLRPAHHVPCLETPLLTRVVSASPVALCLGDGVGSGVCQGSGVSSFSFLGGGALRKVLRLLVFSKDGRAVRQHKRKLGAPSGVTDFHLGTKISNQGI